MFVIKVCNLRKQSLIFILNGFNYSTMQGIWLNDVIYNRLHLSSHLINVYSHSPLSYFLQPPNIPEEEPEEEEVQQQQQPAQQKQMFSPSTNNPINKNHHPMHQMSRPMAHSDVINNQVQGIQQQQGQLGKRRNTTKPPRKPKKQKVSRCFGCEKFMYL